MKRMPRWVRVAVYERDGGRCSHIKEDGELCGRLTELFIEDRGDRLMRAWDPDEFKLVCLYHLEGGVAFDEVDWRAAARA